MFVGNNSQDKEGDDTLDESIDDIDSHAEWSVEEGSEDKKS